MRHYLYKRLYSRKYLNFMYLLLFSLSCILLYLGHGYLGVLLAPQIAYLNEPTKFEILEYEKEINSIEVSLSRLNTFLLGGKQIGIHLTTTEGVYVLNIDSSEILLNSHVRITDGEFWASENYSGTNRSNCISVPFSSNIIGYFEPESFEQGLKNLKTTGQIHIQKAEFKTNVNCRQGNTYVNEIVTQEINEILFKIEVNSGVIYEWSSKGGKTYRI